MREDVAAGGSGVACIRVTFEPDPTPRGMRTLVMILCGVALTPCAQGQRSAYIAHNRLLDSASALLASARFTDAIPVYEDALVVMPWCPGAYFEPVLASLSIGDAERANHFLSMGVQHGFMPQLFYDSLLNVHWASQASKPFRDRWYQDMLVFAAGADSNLITVLDSMVEVDQDHRSNIHDPVLIHQVDSSNFEKLIAICTEQGFPSARIIGHGIGKVNLLLFHHANAEYPDSPQWQRILPYIHAAINAGDLDPAYLCMFDDFSDHDAVRPQRFGALVGFYRNKPEEIYLLDRDQVDLNRASVGWGPIDDFARTVGVDLSTVRFAEP